MASSKSTPTASTSVKTAAPRRKVAVKTAAAAVRKAVGWSLHLGLNAVDAKHYGGWDGQLTACEFDANDMAAIARSRGLQPTVLLTRNSTRAKVLAALRKAAKTLKSGDLFVLSYSGHGGQVDDVTGEEADKLDETWCLYDGQLIDDELYLELSRFAEGVRVLVLSDSCHSGTVTRAAPPNLGSATPGIKNRQMPPAVARRTYQAHQAFYDGLQRAVLKDSGSKALTDPDTVLSSLNLASARLTSIVSDFKPAVILISGCQDNQTSMDGEHNGAFTERLLRVWKSGAFKGNHAQFHAKIKAGMPATQSPNLFVLGSAAGFLAQAPFTV
jgi:hypothetical protein